MRLNILYRTLAGVMLTSGLMAAPALMAQQAPLASDVVVVGGGAAGLAAAVSAAQNGASVILLEKEPALGGAAAMAEGLFAVESEQERRTASPYTKDEVFKHAMEFNHWRADAALVHHVIDESPKTIAWLTSLGLDFDPVTISPSEPPVWHLVKEYKSFHHGGALIACLNDRANELGVKILLATPATSLIFDNGKVAGVNATDAQGNKLAIHAKAVILATGGFPGSKEMIAKYTRYNPDKVFATYPLHKVGDGINMAASAGAEIKPDLGLMLHPGTVGKGVTPLGAIFAMSWQPLLWVNKYGDRFCDEAVAHSFAMAGNAIYNQRDSYAWSIWDDETNKYAEEKGIDNGVGVLIPIGTKLTGLPKEIKRAVEGHSDAFFAADSIEELAKQINIDPARLKATVDHYNNNLDRGHDDQFAKEPRYAMPVKTGHYYALKLVPMFFTSIGGVHVNPDFQAINSEDQPIPGLYIGGSDLGGNFGDTYTLWTSGYAFGLAASSGRITGAEAAAFVGAVKH